MSEKKTLNEEQLEQVVGGTVLEVPHTDKFDGFVDKTLGNNTGRPEPEGFASDPIIGDPYSPNINKRQ